KKWTLERDGTTGAATVNTGTLTPGTTYATVVAAWTATTLALSVNGSNLTPVSNSNVPTLAATQLDIGSAAGSNQIDGDILWTAPATGTPTTSDSPPPKNLANTAPTPTPLAAKGQTAVWTANNTAVQVPGGGTTTTNSFTYNLADELTQATVASTTTAY